MISTILSRTSSKPVVCCRETYNREAPSAKDPPSLWRASVFVKTSPGQVAAAGDSWWKTTRLRSGELRRGTQVIRLIFLLIGLCMLEYSFWIFILYFYSKKYNLLNYIILVFLLTVVILFYIYLQIYLPTRSHICTQRESINKWLLLLLKKSSLRR